MRHFLACLFIFAAGILRAAPEIPSLDWEMRSDWVSVKAPQTWHGTKAIGDGVADDTSAIQLAIGAVAIEGGTVYLPPGTYRITDTLLLGTLQQGSGTRMRGFSIIGCGRDTKILWDGPAGIPMVSLLGICESRIVGVEFDARKKAKACFEMGGPAFQSHNLFRHCAFKNGKVAGIMSGFRKMNTACTEQRMENCLFENNGNAVWLADFNDYDCVIAGCEFRGNEIGVKTFKGNFYCRDTHFENSSKTDFHVESEHTSTIRRCTSFGSYRFLVQRNPQCATILQDCHVAGWRAPDGAIQQNIVPALIFDCTFKNTAKAGPALVFAHTDSEKLVNSNHSDDRFKLLTANCVFDGIAGEKPIVYDLDDGAEIPPNGLTPKTSFLQTKAVHHVRTDEANTACIPGKIFDVKRDFGAKGGEADDTAAFQAAIQAAKSAGNGAMVYIPRGHFTVRKTLVLDGEDWFFGGSGLATTISWYGEVDGIPLHVKSPKTVGVIDFQFMRMGGRRDGIDLLQTGGEGGSFALYDNVRFHGFLIADADKRGACFRNLGKGDVVHSIATYGNMHLENSAAAEILVDSHYEGCLRVTGENPDRSGLAAFQFALLEICNPCIWITQNNSFVMTDFYNEQSQMLYKFEGGADLPHGRISLGSIKVENVPRNVNGYHGEILLGTPQYYNNMLNGVSKWSVTPDSDVDYLELGGYYFVHSLQWPDGGAFRPRFLGAGGGPAKIETLDEFRRRLKDAPLDDKTMALATAFLNDMRAVGKLELRLNFNR